MSKETFLRLPEEKRSRILDAAWEEFLRVKFADASINKIILRARIPRGSFYQYFTDKEDLFAYLLRDIREQYEELFGELLLQARGNLFTVILLAYDRFVGAGENPDPLLDRCVRLMRLNAGMDMSQMLPVRQEEDLVERFWERVDTTAFRQQEPRPVQQAFSLMGMALASAIMESLCAPQKRAECRMELEGKLNIIKYGCLTAPV